MAHSAYLSLYRPSGSLQGTALSTGQTDVELQFCLNGLRPEVSRAAVLQKLMEPQPDGVEATFSHVWVTELTIDRLEWWKVRSLGPIAYGGYYANVYRVTLRLTLAAVADTPAEAVARWAARCFWQASRFTREEGAPPVPGDAAPLYAALDAGGLCNAAQLPPPAGWEEDAPVPLACFRMARRTAAPIVTPPVPPPTSPTERAEFYRSVSIETPWSAAQVAFAAGAVAGVAGLVVAIAAAVASRRQRRSQADASAGRHAKPRRNRQKPRRSERGAPSERGKP